MLNERREKLLCVRGNCEAEVDQRVLSFPVMADYALLPVGKRTLFITHGHVHNLQQLPPMMPGDVLLHGHTHIPAWMPFGDDNLYLNPGSVSIPKEGSAHSCILLEDGVLTWKDLETRAAYHTLSL